MAMPSPEVTYTFTSIGVLRESIGSGIWQLVASGCGLSLTDGKRLVADVRVEWSYVFISGELSALQKPFGAAPSFDQRNAALVDFVDRLRLAVARSGEHEI